MLEVILGLPGTGKTTTLIERVKTLIYKEYNPEDFVICTFRKEMAREMKGRLIQNASPNFKDAEYISTIHGICKRLLGLEKQQIVTEKHIVDFAEANNLSFEPKGGRDDEHTFSQSDEETPFLNQILQVRSWLVNTMRPMEEWRSCPNKPPNHMINNENFLKATAEWEAWKADRSLYDFEDMLTEVYDKNLMPEVPLLFVDEFQDVNPLIYTIYQFWKEGKKEVIIAGDPNQSIYSFMGASPSFFEAERAIADKRTTLGESHRLPAPVWDYAKRILKRSGVVIPLIIPAAHPGVVAILPERKYDNVCLTLAEREVMHLVRCRYMKGIVVSRLDEQGIPHDLCPKKQLRVLDALRKVRRAEPIENADFKALISAYPKKYIMGHTKKALLADLGNSPTTGRLAPWVPTLQWIFTPEALAAMKGPRPFDNILDSVIPNEAVNRLTKSLGYTGSATHHILTIHAAKGREAETVFLYDASSRKIHQSVEFASGKQEEIRVAFVGATRAKKNLLIVQDFFYTRYRLQLPYLSDEHRLPPVETL